jgi:formate hydrogenlyase subunit 3/multisubunit Na+/H+ antiporter MnhD subunit
VVGRATALLPEGALFSALALAFMAAVVGGPRAGRLAKAAWGGGAAVGLLAAVLTVGEADDFLFGAYRVDAFSQFVKALVLAGALAAVHAGRTEHAARVTGPFLRLASVTALVAAASAADLLLLWLLCELATVAHIVVVGGEGRWSSNERAVRALVAAWLPTALVFALGTVIAAAAAETTRFAQIEGVFPAAGGLLILVALVARAGLAPWRAAVAIAGGAEGMPIAVLAGASLWTLLVAAAIRVAALLAGASGAWTIPALIALAAVPAGMAALVVTRGAAPRPGRLPGVVAALIGLAVFSGALALAPAAGAALP